jgi:hypothetical protein
MTIRLTCVFLLLLIAFNAYAQQEWRTPATVGRIYLKLETGTGIIELASFMAPKHATQFKK